MKRVAQWIFFLFFAGWMGLPAALAEENTLPTLNAGIDQLAFQVTRQVADRYFDEKKRPVTRVVVFDFLDSEGNITVGSSYVSTRIRLAFAEGSQFEVLPVQNLEALGVVVSEKEFSRNPTFRNDIVDMFEADVYVFGTLFAGGNLDVNCNVKIWGIKAPFTDLFDIDPVTEISNSLAWELGFPPEGRKFFKLVLTEGAQSSLGSDKEKTRSDVIFLTQPIWDDLNTAWRLNDGFLYVDTESGSISEIGNRAGLVVQSRIKSEKGLRGVNSIIRNFTLSVKGGELESLKLHPYLIQEKSDLYFIPMGKGKSLRFVYVWGRRGLSSIPATQASARKWRVTLAEKDYKTTMRVGKHMATATISPSQESTFGSVMEMPEYILKFKFEVKQGLNIYVVNYAFRRGTPKIFVKRVEIEGHRDVPVGSIEKILQVYPVYGSD